MALRSKASGFLIVEMIVVLAILTFIGSVLARKQLEARRVAQAQVQGDHLELLRLASEKYILDNASPLQGGFDVVRGSVTLVAGNEDGQSYRPGIAQLIALNYLPHGFAESGSFFLEGSPGRYRVLLARRPSGCAPVECDVAGMVYLDQPLTANGKPFAPGITALLARLGGNGGSSVVGSANQISGNGHGWSEANPVAGEPAGIVAARVGLNASGLSAYVRLRDNRDPQLQGQLSVAGDIIGDTLQTPQKAIGGSCSEDDAIATGASGVLQCRNGGWRNLVQFAQSGGACTGSGSAIDPADSASLLCRNGSWTALLSQLPRNVALNRLVVQDGDTIDKPACGSGSNPDRSLVLIGSVVDVTVTPPFQATILTTLDLGNRWQVVLKLKDNFGNEISGNTVQAKATLEPECRF